MTDARILIVEDEKDISDLLKLQLTQSGHHVTVIEDGSKALDFIQNPANKFELFILDRMLPGADGLAICKFLRMYKHTKASPILMLTAMTSEEHIIEGLDAGADDYVTKPFDIPILMARVRSLLRRTSILKNQQESQENSSILRMKELRVDTNQCKVWAKDKELELTLSEYKLLCSFLQQPGKVLTRNQLVEYIQDGPVHVTDRTIDTHVFGLRKKLGEYASLIETVRGIGYRVANEEN